MSTLLELTAQIVSAHLSNVQMTSDEMLQELQKVHASLKALETGQPTAIEPASITEAPRLSIKQAFKKDEVICMICGKGGFKTLKRHLTVAHNLKPGQYRKQFNIPSTQSLAAKSYVESRRQTAIDKGLGEGLAKFRANKKKAAVPIVKIKAPVPTVKAKVSVPAVKTKAAVPTKVAKMK